MTPFLNTQICKLAYILAMNQKLCTRIFIAYNTNHKVAAHAGAVMQ